MRGTRASAKRPAATELPATLNLTTASTEHGRERTQHGAHGRGGGAVGWRPVRRRIAHTFPVAPRPRPGVHRQARSRSHTHSQSTAACRRAQRAPSSRTPDAACGAGSCCSTRRGGPCVERCGSTRTRGARPSGRAWRPRARLPGARAVARGTRTRAPDFPSLIKLLSLFFFFFFSLSLTSGTKQSEVTEVRHDLEEEEKKHGGGCQQKRSCERVGTAWSCVRGARVGGRAARSKGCDRGGRGGRGEAAKLGDEYKANEAATRFTLLPHVYSATYCTKRAVLGAPGKATLRIMGEAGSSRERTCALSPSSHRRWGLQGRHTLFGPTARRPRAPIRTRARSRRGPSTPRG